MRRVNPGQPPASQGMLTPEMRWVTNAIAEIARASNENDQRVIASGFTVTNITTTRTLDGNTATLDDLINFIGTLVLDLRAGEVRKN